MSRPATTHRMLQTGTLIMRQEQKFCKDGQRQGGLAGLPGGYGGRQRTPWQRCSPATVAFPPPCAFHVKSELSQKGARWDRASGTLQIAVHAGLVHACG